LIISKKDFGLFIIPIQYVCHNKVNFLNMINVFCSIKVHWLVMKINLVVVNTLEIYNLSMKVNWSGGSQSTLYEIQNGAVLVADCLFERLYITITTTADVYNAHNNDVRLYRKLFVGGIMSYLRYLCLFTYSGVQHILCCVFVLFFFVLCTLCCQLFWTVHFWLPLRCSLTFI